MNSMFQAHKRKRDDVSEGLLKDSKKVKAYTQETHKTKRDDASEILKDSKKDNDYAQEAHKRKRADVSEGSKDSEKLEANLFMSPYDMYLSPWETSQIPERLPPLPKVLDRTLEKSAFIHQHVANARSTDLSYERLEWVGDAYIYQFSTIIISKTFPSLLPGKCSQLREKCVKNVTLAGYAKEYGFEKRLVLPQHLIDNSHKKEDEKIKILGDVFEAYVAAVILSDPVDGLKMAANWLKMLWGRTIKKEIENEERQGTHYDSPMWRLRGDEDEATRKVGEQPKLNPKDELRKMIGCKGVKLDYKDASPERKDPETKLPLFTVGVYMTGHGETEKLLGIGTAHGKKDAGMKAAQAALNNSKAMKQYAEKKRLVVAQQEQLKGNLGDKG